MPRIASKILEPIEGGPPAAGRWSPVVNFAGPLAMWEVALIRVAPWVGVLLLLSSFYWINRSMPLFGIFALSGCLMLGLSLLLYTKKIGKQLAATADDLRLLEDPLDENQYLVQVEISHQGTLTGRDRGILEVAEDHLAFSGHRTSFLIGGQDAEVKDLSRTFILGDHASLKLRNSPGTSPLKIKLLRRPGMRKDDEIEMQRAIWLFQQHHLPTAQPRNYPPLAPHPDAMRETLGEIRVSFWLRISVIVAFLAAIPFGHLDWILGVNGLLQVCGAFVDRSRHKSAAKVYVKLQRENPDALSLLSPGDPKS